MCGIAGYFGTQPPARERVERCLSLMRRRGPDHAACRSWVGSDGRHAILLHSRLSIIDLDDRANQPFRHDDSWIALNGELYNYIEIREALTKRGTTFSTNSDTEVLLGALADGGPRRWTSAKACGHSHSTM